jgi:DNA end-binding protein Ku
VHFALRNKTRLAALRVKDFSKRDVMVIHTLLWPDEIRDPDFPVLDKEVEIKPAELKMASQVVESMTDDFNPSATTTTTRSSCTELVQAKLEGGEAFTTEERAEGARRDRGRVGSAGQARGQREGATRRRVIGDGQRHEGTGQEVRRQEGAAKKVAKKTAKKAPAKKAAKKAAAKK